MSRLPLAEFWTTPSKVTYSPYIAANCLMCYQQSVDSKHDTAPDSLPWQSLLTLMQPQHQVDDHSVASTVLMIYKISIEQNPQHCHDLVRADGGYNVLPFLLKCIRNRMGRPECHYACIALSNLAILETSRATMAEEATLRTIMDVTSQILQLDPEHAQTLCYCLLHLSYVKPQLLMFQGINPTTSRHSFLRVLEIFLHDLMHAMPPSDNILHPVKIKLEPTTPLCIAAATLRSIGCLVQALARDEAQALLLLKTSIPSYILEILLRLDVHQAERWTMHGLGDVCSRVILNLARRKEFKRRLERLGSEEYNDTLNIALSVITEEVGPHSLKGFLVCVLLGEPLSQFLPGTTRQLVDVIKLFVDMHDAAQNSGSVSFVEKHQEYIRLILDLSTVVKAYRNLVASATHIWEFKELGSPDAIACLFIILSTHHYDGNSKAYAVEALVRSIPVLLGEEAMDMKISVDDQSTHRAAQDIYQVLWEFGNPPRGCVRTNAHRNALKAAEKIKHTKPWDSSVLVLAHQLWKSHESAKLSGLSKAEPS